MREPRCVNKTSSSKFRPEPPARALTVALLIYIGLGVRSGRDSLGAAGIVLPFEPDADDMGASVAWGLVTPSADTAEVSGRLGPLLANVFQNHEGVNFDAPLSSGLVVLELREPSPTIVVDPALEEFEIVERPERMEDCEGDVLRASDGPAVNNDWIGFTSGDSSSAGGR